MHELKEKRMNWNQIEVKWAAMVCRVRSDLPGTTQAGPDEDPSASQPNDLPEPPLPEPAESDAG